MADENVGEASTWAVAPFVERLFRVIEMAGILALIKLIVGVSYPGVATAVVWVGSMLVAYATLERAMDSVINSVSIVISGPSWWRRRSFLSGMAILFLWALLTAATAMGVIGLSSLIAAYMASH